MPAILSPEFMESIMLVFNYRQCLSVHVCLYGGCVCNCSVCALQITLGTLLPNFYLACSCSTFLGECESHIDICFIENRKETN